MAATFGTQENVNHHASNNDSDEEVVCELILQNGKKLEEYKLEEKIKPEAQIKPENSHVEVVDLASGELNSNLPHFSLNNTLLWALLFRCTIFTRV